MKKVLLLSTLSATSLLAFNASAQDILARVLSSTPVVQQVAVPRQVCNNQQVVTQAPKTGGGALLGAVAGGAVGNAIGNGGGRAAATFIGLVGGAMLGDRVEGGGTSQVQNVQQCSTQTFYENRASHYNVVYEYQGTQYNVQMAQDPGPFVKLQVTPVGGLPAAPPQQNTPQSQFQPVQQPIQQPVQFIQPQTFYQQVPAQPGYVVQQPVYLAPVVVQSYSTFYPTGFAQPFYPSHFHSGFGRPFNSPFYGSSVNFGYSRGFGHWR